MSATDSGATDGSVILAMMPNKTVLVAVPATLVGMVLWEHFTKITKSRLRPSFLIRDAGTYCKDKFYSLGENFAKVAEYVKYLKLDELFESCFDLAVASGQLVVSPFYTVKGYATYYASCIDKNRAAITVGTGAIVSSAIIAVNYSEHILPRLNFEFVKSLTQNISWPTHFGVPFLSKAQ